MRRLRTIESGDRVLSIVGLDLDRFRIYIGRSASLEVLEVPSHALLVDFISGDLDKVVNTKHLFNFMMWSLRDLGIYNHTPHYSEN